MTSHILTIHRCGESFSDYCHRNRDPFVASSLIQQGKRTNDSVSECSPSHHFQTFVCHVTCTMLRSARWKENPEKIGFLKVIAFGTVSIPATT